ncbi:MAG: hypothetical protein U9Q75_10535, partial [Pseudomonadota bacterium]|nr:hypothetical protein [Pseudomonadota bacterium]
DQQLRLDIDWQDMLDAERLNHFLDLAHISHRDNTEKLLLNLGAGRNAGKNAGKNAGENSRTHSSNTGAESGNDTCIVGRAH